MVSRIIAALSFLTGKTERDYEWDYLKPSVFTRAALSFLTCLGGPYSLRVDRLWFSLISLALPRMHAVCPPPVPHTEHTACLSAKLQTITAGMAQRRKRRPQLLNGALLTALGIASLKTQIGVFRSSTRVAGRGSE